MTIRDDIADEALATAKRWSHPVVEPRHMLWAIVKILGPEAIPGATPDVVRGYLAPEGEAAVTPSVAPEAQAAVDACVSKSAAAEQGALILASLAAGGATGGAGSGPAGPGGDGTPADPGTDGGAGGAGGAGPAGQGSVTDPKVGQAARTASAAAAPGSTAPVAKPDAASLDQLLAELDGLVGLASVKVEIRKLVAVQRLNAERRTQGLPEVTGSAHLVFTGDPGTGKTTVARLVARLYGALGLVTKGHLVETTRADLVAGYVGQTALKVAEVVRTAVGGVLFIDEAYALAPSDPQDFGAEAIATLVKLMEDHRSNMAVIVAGYRDEMWDFIRSNPGLRSRFTRYIDFPNYTPDELASIFETMAASAKVAVDEGTRAKVLETLATASKIEDFGNARYVRTLFEQAFANMAARALEDGRIDPDEVGLMKAQDIPGGETPAGGHSRHIGFEARS